MLTKQPVSLGRRLPRLPAILFRERSEEEEGRKEGKRERGRKERERGGKFLTGKGTDREFRGVCKRFAAYADGMEKPPVGAGQGVRVFVESLLNLRKFSGKTSGVLRIRIERRINDGTCLLLSSDSMYGRPSIARGQALNLVDRKQRLGEIKSKSSIEERLSSSEQVNVNTTVDSGEGYGRIGLLPFNVQLCPNCKDAFNRILSRASFERPL